jgi:hypothetical protein
MDTQVIEKKTQHISSSFLNLFVLAYNKLIPSAPVKSYYDLMYLLMQQEKQKKKLFVDFFIRNFDEDNVPLDSHFMKFTEDEWFEFVQNYLDSLEKFNLDNYSGYSDVKEVDNRNDRFDKLEDSLTHDYLVKISVLLSSILRDEFVNKCKEKTLFFILYVLFYNLNFIDLEKNGIGINLGAFYNRITRDESDKNFYNGRGDYSDGKFWHNFLKDWVNFQKDTRCQDIKNTIKNYFFKLVDSDASARDFDIDALMVDVVNRDKKQAVPDNFNQEIGILDRFTLHLFNKEIWNRFEVAYEYRFQYFVCYLSDIDFKSNPVEKNTLMTCRGIEEFLKNRPNFKEINDKTIARFSSRCKLTLWSGLAFIFLYNRTPFELENLKNCEFIEDVMKKLTDEDIEYINQWGRNTKIEISNQEIDSKLGEKYIEMNKLNQLIEKRKKMTPTQRGSFQKSNPQAETLEQLNTKFNKLNAAFLKEEKNSGKLFVTNFIVEKQRNCKPMVQSKYIEDVEAMKQKCIEALQVSGAIKFIQNSKQTPNIDQVWLEFGKNAAFLANIIDSIKPFLNNTYADFLITFINCIIQVKSTFDKNPSRGFQNLKKLGNFRNNNIDKKSFDAGNMLKTIFDIIKITKMLGQHDLCLKDGVSCDTISNIVGKIDTKENTSAKLESKMCIDIYNCFERQYRAGVDQKLIDECKALIEKQSIAGENKTNLERCIDFWNTVHDMISLSINRLNDLYFHLMEYYSGIKIAENKDYKEQDEAFFSKLLSSSVCIDFKTDTDAKMLRSAMLQDQTMRTGVSDEVGKAYNAFFEEKKTEDLEEISKAVLKGETVSKIFANIETRALETTDQGIEERLVQEKKIIQDNERSVQILIQQNLDSEELKRQILDIEKKSSLTLSKLASIESKIRKVSGSIFIGAVLTISYFVLAACQEPEMQTFFPV